MSTDLTKLRNIGIIAHIDAGKTSISERFLYYSGKTYKIGEVDSGSTVMDYLDEERIRGITIVAAAATFNWNDCLINLIDTPGHIDFTAEVERSLMVIDGAIVVFSGVEGVEAQSEKVWKQSIQHHVPKMAFINKLDRIGGSFDRVVSEIKKTFKDITTLPIQIPVGIESDFNAIIDLVDFKKFEFKGDDGSTVYKSDIPEDLIELAKVKRNDIIELLAENSDKIADLYLSNSEISIDLLKNTIRELTISNKLCPVLCGSAKRNIGVQLLLDAVTYYLPSPKDIPYYRVMNSSMMPAEVSCTSDFLSAIVFKIISNSSGDLLYCRIYSGILKSDDIVINSRTREKFKVKRILRLYSKNVAQIEKAEAGDIIGLIGLKDTVTGDTICGTHKIVSFEKTEFPEAIMSISVEPKYSKDKERLGEIIDILCKEDPTLKAKTHESTGQHLLSGMGELHLEININKIKNEFHLDTRVGVPQVAYKEALKKFGEYVGIFDKTIAEKHYHTEVKFKIESIENNSIEIVNGIKGTISQLPNAWVLAALDALKNGLRTGGNFGYSIINVKATLLAIIGNNDNSMESTVVGASLFGIDKAVSMGTILLEPILKVEILTPESYLGEISNYILQKRATILKVDRNLTNSKMFCEIPLPEMFGFSKQLPKLSGGTAFFSMEPSSYQEAVIPQSF